MIKPARPRPSRSPAFRLAAFAIAVGIFVFSYWLGNRYKSPDLPDLQALLLSPAQTLPGFEIVVDDRPTAFADHVDDWLLLWAGSFDADDLLLLTRAHNRLALDAKQQGRFRVRLLEPNDMNLPDFIQPLQLADDERDRLYRLWQLHPGDKLVFMINPSADLQAVFTGIRDPATMAADFLAILEQLAP